MSLASDLRAALKAALPSSWKVTGFFSPGSRVDVPTVSVWSTDLRHVEGRTSGAYVLETQVAVYTPHQSSPRLDDALDAQLEKVLDALWAIDDVVLDRAQRQASNNETVHAWVLTVLAGITITTEED